MIKLSDMINGGQVIYLDGEEFGRVHYFPEGTRIYADKLGITPFTTRYRVHPSNERGLKELEHYCRAAIQFSKGDRRAIERVDNMARPGRGARRKAPTEVISVRVRADRAAAIREVINHVVREMNVKPSDT